MVLNTDQIIHDVHELLLIFLGELMALGFISFFLNFLNLFFS